MLSYSSKYKQENEGSQYYRRNLATLRYAIGRVVKWLIGRVVEGPYDSTTQLFNYLTKVEEISINCRNFETLN